MGFSTKEITEYYELRYYLESEAIRKILSEPEDRSYQDWLNDLEQLLSESKQYLKYNYAKKKGADYRQCNNL